MGWTEKLDRIRRGLGEKLAALASRMTGRDPTALADLEDTLLLGDFGPEAARRVVAEARRGLAASSGRDPDAAREQLAAILEQSLSVPARAVPRMTGRLDVVLLVGPHGVGKTTTAGKLACLHAREGRKVILAAGDTHRAAAIEQLEEWARRLATRGGGGAIECVAQSHGADPAAVIFDAVGRARAAGAEILVADTAGRIHTKLPLMEALGKVDRAMQKALGGSPYEAFLVVDATMGQNGLAAAGTFAQALPLSGLILTKLDGTAKGGLAFALVEKLKVPVRYVGVGEGPEDLAPFDPRAFSRALLGLSA